MTTDTQAYLKTPLSEMRVSDAQANGEEAPTLPAAQPPKSETERERLTRMQRELAEKVRTPQMQPLVDVML